MSEEEQTANPYNARKNWHQSDVQESKNAESLFFEEQATSEDGTPEEKKPPRKTTTKRDMTI